MKSQLSSKNKALTRQQLGQAVEGMLSGLAAVEARLGTKAWLASLIGAGATQGVQAERLREVLDRDRALVTAGPPRGSERVEPTAPSPAAAIAPAAPPAAVCDEPIRTRTMARLLATQGHRARALSIYEHLLAHGDSDPCLRSEAELLRAQAS
jgi:hypothetical protein